MGPEKLNLYIDALLSISESPDENRDSLIELAYFHDDWPNFLAEWLWLNHKSLESALQLKIWLGWRYEDLADVYALDFREFSRLLRSQRIRLLGPYPAVTQDELPNFGGISCFMVEQQLSAWVDVEWEEGAGLDKIYKHLQACGDCGQRLQAYRALQENILSQRRSFTPVSEAEWKRMLARVNRNKKRARLQWLFIFIICVAFIGIILWMLQSQPEKMPNIYELKEG